MTDKTITIIIIARILLGIYWFDHGLGKLESGWLTQDKLSIRLAGNALRAPSYAKPYIKHVLQPAAPVVQKLVLLGELTVGIAFIVGFWTKPAMWGAMFMVLNFKFVDGRLFTWSALSDASLIPLFMAMILTVYLSSSIKGTIMAYVPFLKRYEYPKS